MNFMRSRAEHLAGHLRDQIKRGELFEPLPGTRAWSRTLGVARKTLEEALRILRHEKLITVHARGHRINRAAEGKSIDGTSAPRVAHLLFYARHSQSFSSDVEWVFLLSERLQAHGVQLHVERCSDARIRSIALQGGRPNELFLLAAFTQRQQQLFEKSQRHSLVVGSVADGVSLPFVTVDLAVAVGHATRFLLRSGFNRLHFLIARIVSKGIKESIAAFEDACREWPHQPVHGRTELVALPKSEHLAVARRFASRVTGRLGVIVAEPVPIGMIQTALLERGIGIPSQVELVAVFPSLASVNLCPPLRFYRMPNSRLVKEITDLAVRFFETGKLRRVSKRLPPELVQAGES